MSHQFIGLCCLCAFIFLLGCTRATTVGTVPGQKDTSARTFSAAYEKVFSESVRAAGSLGWQVTFTDRETGIISAQTPTNLLTWGDNVSIQLTRDNSDSIRVDVSSGTQRQIVDWGANSKNIRKFYDKLSELLTVNSTHQLPLAASAP